MFVENDENLVVLRQKVVAKKIDLIVIEIASVEILFVVGNVSTVHQNIKRTMFLQKGLEFMEIAETFRSTLFRSYILECSHRKTFFNQMLHFSCNVLLVNQCQVLFR